jgi:hypothetical protein
MGLSKHQEHCMNVRDFLIDNGFRIGKTDSTLFIRMMSNDLFVSNLC